MTTARFRGTREDVRRLLRTLPAVLAGRAADPLGLARGVQLRCGVALLSKVQQAFVVKSRGGTGEDGIAWPPLSPKTIARRRTTAAELKSLGITGTRVRGFLTPLQNARWKAIYSRSLERGDAPAVAAAKAWAVLKREGAKTKLAVLGSRPVEILRDTGLLFRSLGPGVDGKLTGPGGQFQVFDARPGRVTVGTNRFPWHHDGRPGKLPRRPFWPPDARLPESWWDAVRGAAARGVSEAVVLALARGGPG